MTFFFDFPRDVLYKTLNRHEPLLEIVVMTPHETGQNDVGLFQSQLDRRTLLKFYGDVRSQTEWLCAPLETEDFGVQTMPDVSPTKWHLAHTSWFFETFVLTRYSSNYPVFHEKYDYLFNSYYNAIGKRVPRPQRGFMSRPTVNDIFRYRHHIDEHVENLIETASGETLAEILPLVEVGLHHEHQHQELLLTDIKHVFSFNPLRPVYRERDIPDETEFPDLTWSDVSSGVYRIGHNRKGFAYDNESPAHQTYVQPGRIANRLVTNKEYLAFMTDGGYERSELWLSDGWDTCNQHGWKSPLYWELRDGQWWNMTLSGMRPVCGSEPVCHVSYYEAEAFARWIEARLPTEAEWEIVAREQPFEGNFVWKENLHPVSVQADAAPGSIHQMFGDVWEWTASPYIAYPGYQPLEGALGEYNGKFMCNQMVLRGGSCVSSREHIRATYRNFFQPEARWQFSGIRLAKDA